MVAFAGEMLAQRFLATLPIYRLFKNLQPLVSSVRSAGFVVALLNTHTIAFPAQSSSAVSAVSGAGGFRVISL
jgi:hypothetical protein